MLSRMGLAAARASASAAGPQGAPMHRIVGRLAEIGPGGVAQQAGGGQGVVRHRLWPPQRLRSAAAPTALPASRAATAVVA